MTRKQQVRAYGRHLGLMTRYRDGVFTLSERYDQKRKLGTYRSVTALERGIDRQADRMLRELKRELTREEIRKVVR